MQELIGTVEKIVFTNTQTGFSIFVLAYTKHETTTVTACAPSLEVGHNVQLKGSWITHPKFGKQFQATSCTPVLPTSIIGLKKYLGSGMIKGIGESYATKLVDHFGTEVLHVIEHEPERLKEVAGIGYKRLETILATWKTQKDTADIMIFLQSKGISAAYALKIYKKYEGATIAKILENPYRIAEDIWGVGFKMADTLAQSLGFEKNSLKRCIAGILFTITQSTQQGNLYAKLEELRTQTLTLLELPIDADHLNLIKQALHLLYEQDKIKIITTEEDEHFITTSLYYHTEYSLSQKIRSLLDHRKNNLIDTEKAYQTLRVQKTSEIALNDFQQQGIMTALGHKISIITGGPGTGKTTLIKKLLELLEEQQISYKLAAPTGRAAKRMSEGTRRYATTLHRLLEFDPHTMQFIHNETNALKLDYLIIDEASMIDIFLAHGVLKALPLSAHLILIGDIHQLPSVGAGNFLQDLIKSGIIPVTKLEFIFRQAHNSLITINAHRINNGEFPVSFEEHSNKDYFFIKEEDPANLTGHINKILHTTLTSFGIPQEELFVLSPMHKGSAGNQTLNDYLQKVINPGPLQEGITFMSTTFKLGDRVMQIRNNYDKKIFNGDIGTITFLQKNEQVLKVTFQEQEITYQSHELNELVLAYSLSIHKSQGSEFQAIIIPLFMQHFTLLARNLLYTALTRAKKLCILIGQPKAIIMAIKNNKSIERITFLKEYLTTSLKAR